MILSFFRRRRKASPPALAWDRIDALLANNAQWRTVVTEAQKGDSLASIDAGSRIHSAEAWFYGLYFYEAHIASLTAELEETASPTAEQAARWDNGGAEDYWTPRHIAYAALVEARLQVNIHLSALGFIRIRATRAGEVA